jgi:hypothetical protein
MGWFDNASDQADYSDQVGTSSTAMAFWLRIVLVSDLASTFQYNNAPPHKAALSHEVIGGAAAYEVNGHTTLAYSPLIFTATRP